MLSLEVKVLIYELNILKKKLYVFDCVVSKKNSYETVTQIMQIQT